jgi:hypothetical protein
MVYSRRWPEKNDDQGLVARGIVARLDDTFELTLLESQGASPGYGRPSVTVYSSGQRQIACLALDLGNPTLQRDREALRNESEGSS